MDNFSKILKNTLEEQGVSQKWLAQRAETTEATISRFVNEKRKPAVLDIICNIAKALNVSTDYLLGLTTIKNYDYKMSSEEAILISALRKATDAEYDAIVALMRQHMTPAEVAQFEKLSAERKKGVV